MSEVTIQVQQREATGKGPSRRLRREGWIPAVVYGGGKEPIAIKIERTTFLDLLRTTGSENAVFLLELAGTGKKRHTMVRRIDADPITRRVEHIDFLRVVMDQLVRVTVPIELEGESDGVKNQGAVLDFVTRSVGVECLPAAIPRVFVLDVEPLEIGDHRVLGDLELPEGVELTDETDKVVVAVAAPRVEEEEEEELETLLEAEAEEPEVIGKGKGEDDEEEGAGQG